MVTGQIINNTLFEKKHHYMFALKEIEILKRQMEREALDNELESSRLNEVHTIWNFIFVGLLREGLAYQVIKNATDAKKDMIRITIDGVNYECKILTLKEILKDEFLIVLKDITETIDVNPEPAKKANSARSQKKAEKEAESIDIPLEETNSSAENIDLAGLNNNKLNLDSESFIDDVVSDIKMDLDTKKDIPVPKEECLKSMKTMIYNSYLAEVLPPGATEGEKMEIFVIPKKIEENNNKTDIMVIIKNKRDIRCYYSEKTASVIADFNENQFLIRGMFSNGEFSSTVLTSGATAALNCSLNLDLTEHKCEDTSVINYGHVCYTLKNNSNNPMGIIHVIPLLEDENNKYGIADVAVFIEQDGVIKRSIVNRDAKAMAITINAETVSLLNYWQNGYLSSEPLKKVN